MKFFHHLEKPAHQKLSNMQMKASPMLRCHGIHPFLQTMMAQYPSCLSQLRHHTSLLRVNTAWHIQRWIKQEIKLIAHSTSKWKVQYFCHPQTFEINPGFWGSAPSLDEVWDLGLSCWSSKNVWSFSFTLPWSCGTQQWETGWCYMRQQIWQCVPLPVWRRF